MTIQAFGIIGYKTVNGDLHYLVAGKSDALATAIRHIVPVWPVPFQADVIHECDACREHDACMTVNDEAFCEECLKRECDARFAAGVLCVCSNCGLL